MRTCIRGEACHAGESLFIKLGPIFEHPLAALANPAAQDGAAAVIAGPKVYPWASDSGSY
jgi:hypothetical protein